MHVPVIMAVNTWATVQGRSVCAHLVKRFSALEEHMRTTRDDYIVPPSTPLPSADATPDNITPGTATPEKATADAAP
jgi:hypothetical protein